MSSNDIVSVYFLNLLIITQVLSILSATVEKEYIKDQGENITISCNGEENSVMWIRRFHDNNILILAEQQTLIITNVTGADSGTYICLLKYPIYNIITASISAATKDSSISDNLQKTNSNNLTNYQQIQHHHHHHHHNYEQDHYPHHHHQINDDREVLKIHLIVRTTPGPVTKLYFKPSTILGYLIWRFDSKYNSGGYPIKSFTAEYRNVSLNHNETYEWIRLDPINISPNVRQMEVYHLLPNSTYEFRIWANNQLGSGDIVTTNITTLPEVKEEDLIRLIQSDIDNFDPRIWIAAVSIFFGTLVILATGLCIVLAKEFNQSSSPTLVDEEDDGVDSIELVPNIILNPGFVESDDQETPYTRTIIFGEDDESDGYDDYDEEEHEPPIEAFKRKVSIFFTGSTIRRL